MVRPGLFASPSDGTPNQEGTHQGALIKGRNRRVLHILEGTHRPRELYYTGEPHPRAVQEELMPCKVRTLHGLGDIRPRTV